MGKLSARMNGSIKYLEVFGLVILMMTVIWKGYSLDWWDNGKIKSQYYHQEKANFIIIDGINDILEYETINKPEREEFIKYAREKLEKGIFQLASERENIIKNMDAGQMARDSIIQFCLSIFGATLIILGKIFELKTKL